MPGSVFFVLTHLISTTIYKGGSSVLSVSEMKKLRQGERREGNSQMDCCLDPGICTRSQALDQASSLAGTCARTLTKGMLKAAGHEGVVSIQDAQGVVLGVLQHQAETEAVVPHLLGVHGDLVEHVPEVGPADILHHHYPEIEGQREGEKKAKRRPSSFVRMKPFSAVPPTLPCTIPPKGPPQFI